MAADSCRERFDSSLNSPNQRSVELLLKTSIAVLICKSIRQRSNIYESFVKWVIHSLIFVNVFQHTFTSRP
jgi:hypothetical protein